MTYTNPDSYSMHANGGFGEPTQDYGFANDTISEGPMAGQQWGYFYAGGGLNVANGTASKTFTIADGANGGSINFGFFVKAGAEQNSYIDRQDITVNTNCPAPPTTEVCTTVTPSPAVTNQNSRGWTFGTSGNNGTVTFVSDGVNLKTTGWTIQDKASLDLGPIDIALKDVGVPKIDYDQVSGVAPGIQMAVDFDNDSTIDSYLIGEEVYQTGAGEIDYWLSGSAPQWVKDGAPVVGGGNGSQWHGSLDQWLVSFPDARVLDVSVAIGRYALGESVVHSFEIGCVNYPFVADNVYDAPASTVNVDDSQIAPFEDGNSASPTYNYETWHEGYNNAARAYSTQADGLHLGVGAHSQIMLGTPGPITADALEALLTSASLDVVSGSVTFQVPVFYGTNNSFTTLRSTSLAVGADHRFSVSDIWVSSSALKNNNGTTYTPTYATPMADLVDFMRTQGNIQLLGFGVQADNPAVVQYLEFNGTEYNFVPSSATAVTNHVVVPESEIDTFEAGDGSNYTNWHEGYANASKSFSVDSTGLNLGDPSHSQILKGLDTPVAGTDLYAMLTSQAGVTVDSGTVTYQVAFTHDGAIGWGTLRSASLGAGSHTFSLSDPWMTSKAIGALAANTAYPLGDLLDALVAEGSALGEAFGVQADNAAHISSITFGDTEYSFANPAGTTCEGPDFANGKYEVHLGRGLEERNMPATFNINSFGGLVDADDPSDTFAEIQGYGAGWTNTYIRTVDEAGAGNDFSNGYVITYTFATQIVTGTVTVGPNGCDSLVWTYADPIVAGTPTISGNAIVGETLTADAVASSWTPATGVTFSYVWKADGSPISGATASTYELTSAELGKTISVTVTGTAPGQGSASATSSGTAEVALPAIVAGTPTISGTAKVGQTLTADAVASGWTPATGVTFHYVWFADGSPISAAADSSTYELTAAELGKTITVEVTGTKSGYAPASGTTAPTAAVLNDHIIVERLAGSNRYATAVDISQEFASATRVYIANGLGYADALSAGPAAAHFDAPLLLTPADALPAIVVAELNRLAPDEIVIVGGDGVVSPAVQTALENLAFAPDVRRVAGSNRYATSRAIAEDTWGPGSLGSAYLATGMDFPDALSAAPVAAHFDGPVVLVPGMATSVDALTLAMLNSLGVDEIKIAGGTGVVSAQIQTQMEGLYPGNVTRNGGGNRFITSVLINADEFTSASKVYLAQGMGFPDALAGAAIAGHDGAPLFVSHSNCIPQPVMDAILALDPQKLILLGGTGVLTTDVESMTVCS